MRINKVELDPFGGLVNKSFDFSKGINLIIGPNEAGKSTLFNAISHGLLTTTNLTAGQVDNIMGSYFPVNGGDVIRVTLEFFMDDPEKIYVVKKEWKKGNRAGSTSLIKPDQTEMTNEDEIQEFLNDLLPVQPATMWHVFLAKQSGLHEVFSHVKGNETVRNDIGTILRKSVMETGGISVDRFEKKIDRQFEEYFNNWDRERNYPKPDAQGNDRGINNPHQRNIGSVLQAWYDMENSKERLTQITNFQDSLERLEQELKELEEQKAEQEEQLQTYKPMLEQLNQREIIENQLNAIRERFDEIREISMNWPVYENNLDELVPTLDTLETKLEELNEEQQKASGLAAIRQLKERIEKINRYKKGLSDAEKDIEESTSITKKDLEDLRTIRSEIQTAMTRIEASKLALQIEAKKEIHFNILDASGSSSKISLKNGEKHEAVFDALFKFESDEVVVNVSAGEDDMSEISKKLQKDQQQLKQKLKSFGVETWQEANTVHTLYRDKVNRYEQHQQRYKEELGDDSLEELTRRVNEAGDLQSVRSMEQINRERDDVLEQRNELNGRAREMREKLENWRQEFGDIDAVFQERANITDQKNTKENTLAELPELPEDFESMEEFRAQVNTIENGVNALQANIQDVREELIRAEEQVGEVSEEEQQAILNEKTEQYKKTLSKAVSLSKVKEKTDTLLAEIEKETYEPLIEGLQKWMSLMSDGRFTSVELIEDRKEIPGSFETRDGANLTPQLLSHGTKDLAGLAWKLTVSEKYLANQSGFLLMDDPMVDMDPVRKKLATKALEEFAEDQQIILFSCHPEMKELVNSTHLDMS